MAKPIAPTPDLKGKEAEIFLKELKNTRFGKRFQRGCFCGVKGSSKSSRKTPPPIAMRLDDLFRERLCSPLVKEEFDCGNPDLNEFLANDALSYQQQLLGVTYLLRSKNDKEIAAYFTVLNDGIKASNRLTAL